MAKLIPLITFLLFFISAANAQQNSNFVKHSSITLMPEGEPDDISAFLPLKPTVVAWGMDPIHYSLDLDRMKQQFDAYKKIGVEKLACNVWMLTATNRYMYNNPEYQNAVCVDIEQNPIVPRWLDSEYNGVRPWWGCTNHPLYRELVEKRALTGVKAGANLLHLDDHMGTAAAAIHSGGCFCEHCMDGFTKWLEKNRTKNELEKLNIELRNFDYPQIIKEAGFTTLEKYNQGIENDEIPLHEEFIRFQLEEAAALVKELGENASALAGKKVPVGVNSWNLIPQQLATAHNADYFSNEVEHYGVEDLVPPFVYRLGDGLGKPVFSTGTGEDWILTGEENMPVRINRWIATAYAHGHFFMYSWNKWGFSEETGTQWYQVPIEYYEPYCTFINNNQHLFDGFEAVKTVGVLYENEIVAKENSEVESICRELNYANIPNGLVVSGDDWLKHPLTKKDFDGFQTLVVPPITNLSEDEKKLIDEYGKKHKVIEWESAEVTIKQLPSAIKISGAEKVWALPRKKQGEMAIHLLNQDYIVESDKMNIKTDFELVVDKQIVLNNDAAFELYQPGKNPRKLESEKTASGFTVTIPELDVWGIVRVF